MLINDAVENAALYLKPKTHFGIFAFFFIPFLDFMVADWEYGMQVAQWDDLLPP